MKIIIYLKEETKSKRMIKKITLQVMAKQTTVERGISLNSLNNPMVQPMLQELKVLAQLLELSLFGRNIWHSGFSLS